MSLRLTWEPEIGLWQRPGGGHTKPVAELHAVHSSVDAALRLLISAQLGGAGGFPVLSVLRALRHMQVTDGGPWHGCFRWYWEEPAPIDANAGVLVGLPLLVLQLGFSNFPDDWIAPEQADEAKELISQLFGDMALWFKKEVEEGVISNPNKYMGDLVCAWMLQEIMGRTPIPDLQERMRGAADHWLQSHFSWGEHLSDVYSTFMLNHLSALLMFSGKLPLAIRGRFVDLARELLDVEDAYEGGARVPQIRGYAFDKGVEHVSFRTQIGEWSQDRDEEWIDDMVQHRLMRACFAHVLCEKGWHRKMPPRRAPDPEITVSCLGGSEARAFIQDDVRIGSMSRFPIMPVAEHNNWGLSWQSFPVVVSRTEGDWAFLQWRTVEQGYERCHPAASRVSVATSTALTTSVSPPITGKTYSLQDKGLVLALRIMPMIAGSWQEAGDQFRVLQNHGRLLLQRTEGAFSQLVLGYPDYEISASVLSLGGTAHVNLATDGARRGLTWKASYNREVLGKMRMAVFLWGISLEGRMEEPPVLVPVRDGLPRNPEEQAWTVEWKYPRKTWVVKVDPLAAEPLTNVIFRSEKPVPIQPSR